MLQSESFTKTQKTSPAEEEAINAKLLIRAGYIRKMSAGVYSYLPLAWRVLNKINAIIREEMNAIGAQELLMPALIAKEYWDKSRRWHTDVAYELKSPFGEEFALGWTHEEAITAIASHFINSYKDLPLAVYQIQNKFRAEPRAKSGLLRGREFMMKDLYSFHASKADLDSYYNKVAKAYQKIFKRLGLKTKLTEASGGAFTSEYTHEFQVLAPVGEDTIVYCTACDYAQNKEIAHVRGGALCPKCDSETKESPAIEVGNIFKLGTRYSEPFDLRFATRDGQKEPVIMGSYGIGPTRVMGALAEVYHDDKGLIWPETAAPFRVHLIQMASDKKRVARNADKIHKKLHEDGIEVLHDDREVSAGEKFADADLLGIPWRVVVSEKTGDKIELKNRNAQKIQLVTYEELIRQISKSSKK
jgi:prolyl-tRNA synthetase